MKNTFSRQILLALIQQSKNNVLCFLIGHKESVPMLTENEHFIFSKACPRCKSPMMMPAAWKSVPPPPETSLSDWSVFLIKHLNETRASVNSTVTKNIAK